MRLRLLGAADLERCLPMRDAVEAMKRAYRELSEGSTRVPPRVHLPTSAEGDLALVMPAFAPGRGLGVKVISLHPSNPTRGLPVIQGLVLLLDPVTGTPRGLIEGAALTAWRTGAGAGAGIDLLARADARVGALLGAGAQARAQLLALLATRAVREVRLWSRDPARAAAFAAALGDQVPARLRPVSTPREAVRNADVVLTATPSSRALFDAADLAPGTHLGAIGSFTPQMHEFGADTVQRAKIYVDQRAAAADEAGELIAAREAGLTRPEDWTELGEVVAGRAAGRTSTEELTLFKSVGSAAQDVHAAAEALSAAERMDVGPVVEL